MHIVLSLQSRTCVSHRHIVVHSPTVQWQCADRKDKTFFVCGGKYLPADSPQKLRLFVLFVPLGDHVIKSRKLVEAELIVDH